MAGVRIVAQTVEVPTGTTRKTLLQILAATNQRVLVKEISISFDGVSNVAAPILVEIVRQSTTGSGGDVLTMKKMDPDYSETVQTTALSDIDGTTAPTESDEVQGESVHPQGGYSWQAPFGQEIVVPGGARLGVIVTAAAAVNAKVRLVAEE